jgi:hypothetical protein
MGSSFNKLINKVIHEVIIKKNRAYNRQIAQELEVEDHCAVSTETEHFVKARVKCTMHVNNLFDRLSVHAHSLHFLLTMTILCVPLEQIVLPSKGGHMFLKL